MNGQMLFIVSWRIQNEAYDADVSVKHGDHEYACIQYLYKYYHGKVFHIWRGRSFQLTFTLIEDIVQCGGQPRSNKVSFCNVVSRCFDSLKCRSYIV